MDEPAGRASSVRRIVETPYEQCCRSVLTFLATRMPMATWSVSRLDDRVQTHLYVDGERFARSGSTVSADRTLCHRMVDGAPRRVADATEHDAYADVAAAHGIRGYLAAPIVDDREPVGVLCGLHDRPTREQDLDLGLVEMLADLLSQAHELSRRTRRLELDLRVSRDEALLDDLTGLLNRRGWNAALDLAVERGLDEDGHDVVLVDVDGLKQVNDRDGHLAGDQVLQRVAAAVRAVTGPEDTAARIGGDEFTVLMRAGFHRDDVGDRIDRLRLALEAAGASASVGCAPLGPDGPRAALEAADRAMYLDKAARAEVEGRTGPPAPVGAAGVDPAAIV